MPFLFDWSEGDLYNNCEVVDIQSMDPLMKDWGTLICSYFQPMLPSGVAGIDASYLVGPGTALLTGLMVGLATSNGSTILANAPRGEHELTTAIEMDFVRRGLTSYSELFGGAIIGISSVFLGFKTISGKNFKSSVSS